MTISRNPARARFCMWYSISDLPPTRNKGLGKVSVSGRMRSPRPAARIMAANPVSTFSESVANFQVRLVDLPLVQQCEQGIELAVAFARLAQVIRHQRYVIKITALAIAIIQTRKYSQDLEVALYPHPLEIPVKIRKACRNR